jgi:ribosomal protein S26
MQFDRPTALKAINYEAIQVMVPRSFQQELRSKHIIIADFNLPRISCDRQGLMSLNSLKEVVNIEGIRVHHSNFPKKITD